MKKIFSQKKEGFTLIETIVAIFILSMAMGSLLTLSANGFYSVRYSRNQIVANNLAQEAAEYIRNTRDTMFLGSNSSTVSSIWNTFRYTTMASCFTTNGCVVDIYSNANHFRACASSTCPYMKYYENQGIYGYADSYPFTGGVSYDTSYVRTIKMTPNSPAANYVDVTITVSWMNGSASKTITQPMYLSSWPAYR